jgi:hypothetical protein
VSAQGKQVLILWRLPFDRRCPVALLLELATDPLDIFNQT